MRSTNDRKQSSTLNSIISNLKQCGYVGTLHEVLTGYIASTFEKEKKLGIIDRATASKSMMPGMAFPVVIKPGNAEPEAALAHAVIRGVADGKIYVTVAAISELIDSPGADSGKIECISLPRPVTVIIPAVSASLISYATNSAASHAINIMALKDASSILVGMVLEVQNAVRQDRLFAALSHEISELIERALREARGDEKAFVQHSRLKGGEAEIKHVEIEVIGEGGMIHDVLVRTAFAARINGKLEKRTQESEEKCEAIGIGIRPDMIEADPELADIEGTWVAEIKVRNDKVLVRVVEWQPFTYEDDSSRKNESYPVNLEIEVPVSDEELETLKAVISETTEEHMVDAPWYYDPFMRRFRYGVVHAVAKAAIRLLPAAARKNIPDLLEEVSYLRSRKNETLSP